MTAIRPALRSSASPQTRHQVGHETPALLLRRPESRNTQTSRIAGHSSRVDDRPIRVGVREVLHAVVAEATGELEGALLLLGAPLVAHEARWLQVLARPDGLLPRRAARVQLRAVDDAIDGEGAR